MCKVGFWNLGGATRGEECIQDFLEQDQPDIAGFAEIRQSRRDTPVGYQKLGCEGSLFVVCR